MKKAKSLNIFRAKRLSLEARLPPLETMLKRKHSIFGREDVRLPAMVDGLKSRLDELAKCVPKRLEGVPVKGEYAKIFTREKTMGLIGSFASLYEQFLQLPLVYRKKLHKKLEPLLFNMELIEMLKLPALDEKIITKFIDENPQKTRDFHIIVDCVQKCLMERRSKELESRVRKLRGYNRNWEEGVAEHLNEIELRLGRMDKLNPLTRRVSKLLDESIFELRRSSNRQEAHPSEQEFR